MGKMIFVVGNSRSGTTMMGRILGNHSSIHTFNELHFFETQLSTRDIRDAVKWDRSEQLLAIDKLMTRTREGFFKRVVPGTYRKDAVVIMGDAEFVDPMDLYSSFMFYETKRYSKEMPCEQTPRYLYYITEILEKYPNAYVINMIRDPRDVLLSQKNKWRRRFLLSSKANAVPYFESLRSWANYHPYTMSKLWVSAIMVAREYEGCPHFTSIRYEDLLKDSDSVLRKVCSFLDVEFEPSMLKIPMIGSSTGADRPSQLGIDSGRAGVWRKGGLSAEDLLICQVVAGPEMIRQGYVADTAKASSLTIFRSAIMFLFKSPLAILLNLKRFRNVLDAVASRLRRKNM